MLTFKSEVKGMVGVKDTIRGKVWVRVDIGNIRSLPKLIVGVSV